MQGEKLYILHQIGYFIVALFLFKIIYKDFILQKHYLTKISISILN